MCFTKERLTPFYPTGHYPLNSRKTKSWFGLIVMAFLPFTKEKSFTRILHPNKVTIDNDLLVYQDVNGRLKGFSNGEKYSISSRIAVDFDQINQAVLYRENRFRWHINYTGRRLYSVNDYEASSYRCIA